MYKIVLFNSVNVVEYVILFYACDLRFKIINYTYLKLIENSQQNAIAKFAMKLLVWKMFLIDLILIYLKPLVLPN